MSKFICLSNFTVIDINSILAMSINSYGKLQIGFKSSTVTVTLTTKYIQEFMEYISPELTYLGDGDLMEDLKEKLCQEFSDSSSSDVC